MAATIFLLFFFSGAAALVYEVAWARSLGLVFGASHLAVTTVLAVFMGGLALGSRLLGRRADASTRPLRLYGLLELGTGAAAVLFLLLARLYPLIYGPLARLGENQPVYLSALRVAFAVVAMIVPTTLMGGTLPVLARLVAAHPGTLGRRLPALYALNTLGAVAGSLCCGFLLLPTVGVTASVLLAAATSAVVGAVALLLPGARAGEAFAAPAEPTAPPPGAPGGVVTDGTARALLLGAAAGGFCALGYEVLWTRMLSLVVGTSVYSFTIILVAFLAGIALGSAACTPLQRRLAPDARRAAWSFAAVEVATAIAAVAVTVLMRNLPTQAPQLQAAVARLGATEFGVRQWASFAIAIGYVFVPAFLGGAAFPLAVSARAAAGRAVGRSVGELLSANTIGAILGSAVSGFALIRLFGVERSLQMLAVVNAAAGLAVAATLSRARLAPAGVIVAAVVGLAALGTGTSWGRAWDPKSFALFVNNSRYAYATDFQKQDARDQTDVVYYSEGANEIISVVHPKGAQQSFIVNGRPEASTSPKDMQCQRTLGHLPMLLHRDPRSVFVLGTGTGMTLGATTLHPGVERIVLAEIEPAAIAAGRTFGEVNHHALDDPRLRIAINDGRNFLATTNEKFDVITADPIHPWSGGAAYLYTDEYFHTVAEHLNPGGVASQWLPLYELSTRDVQTVVRTFAGRFSSVMVWITAYDAELVGGNQPLVLDEAELDRRISRPEIARDLAEVQMGSGEAFLSYFALGDAGARAFGEGGVVNTDDNLWLEFSAPKSMGVGTATGRNLEALARARESIVPYLAPAPEPARARQVERWKALEQAARTYDVAHALRELGYANHPQIAAARTLLQQQQPEYAPFRFLEAQLQREDLSRPRLLRQASFPVQAAAGPRMLTVSVVVAAVSETRRAVMFVDNDRRDIYGQRYFDGPAADAWPAMESLAGEVLESLSRRHAEASADATTRGQPAPSEQSIAGLFREAVARATGSK